MPGSIKITAIVAMCLTCLTTTFVARESTAAGQSAADEGIIYAEPNDLSTNIPLAKILETSEFFHDPANKVKIQFPSDQSRYAWVNMSRFYPTAQVMRSGKIANLDYAIDPSIGDVSYQNVKGESLTVDAHFATLPIDALIVVKNGKVAYERYKTMQPEDKHIWFSVSKVTGSTMLAFLEQEGKVDVTRPVSDYLKELKGSVWDTVRVVEALDMATGLNGTEHDEPDHDSRTNPDQLWYRWAATKSIGVVGDVKKRNETWVDVLRAMERVRPPLEVFEYNSIDTFVVNRIAERVADKPLNEQFQERIWSKAGMEHDSYYTISPTGITLGFMGVNSTLRDLARFGMVFTPSAVKIAGEKIIPQAIMDKIHNRDHLDMYGKGWVGQKFNTAFPDDKAIGNSYQWDAVLSDGDMYKSGVGGQGLYISPANDMVVGWFCTGDGNGQEETMARAIVKSLSKK